MCTINSYRNSYRNIMSTIGISNNLSFRPMAEISNTHPSKSTTDAKYRNVIRSFIHSIKDDDDAIDDIIEIFGEDNIKSHLVDKLPAINTIKTNVKQPYEPILDPNNQRFAAFPINPKYQGLWDLYLKQVSSFWKPEEIDFSKDYDNFKMMTPDEQHFIKMILAFFSQSDGIVNFNLSERFTKEIQILEALVAYNFQMMMEDIHNRVYSTMADNIVRDPKEKHLLLNAVETFPAVKMMADWAFRWIDSSESFGHRVIAFAIVEAVFFSGAFASIFWLKNVKNQYGKFMNGLVESNKFIARDEGMHVDFACELYKHVENRVSVESVNIIMREAVQISQYFMTDALPCRLIGMNSEMMCDYIEYIGDRLLNQLGYDKMYNKANPFKFMETIGLDVKTNFHAIRPTEYQDAHVNNKSHDKSKIVINDDDF